MHLDRLSLRANFSWAFAGNSVYAGAQWGIVILLAKLGSPELVGLYTLAIAITSPIFMLTSLRLNTVLTTDAQDKYSLGDFLGLRLLSTMLAIIIIVGIVLLGERGRELLLIVALITLAKSIESISDIIYASIQKQERLDIVARSLMLRGILTLSVFTIALYITESLPLALFAEVVVWASVLWFYDLRKARIWQMTRPKFNRRILLGLGWLALPLGIVAGLNNFSTQMPRYAINFFESTHELGIFSAIMALGAMTGLITNALSGSALPRLSQLFASRDFDRFMRLLFRLMRLGAAVGIAGVIGAILFGKFFLTFVYTEEYAAYTNVLVVVMASVGVVATFTFLGTAVAATQQFAIQVIVHIVKLSAIGVACLLLVPKWGILGAAWAVLVGTLVSSPAYIVIVWRTMHQARLEVMHHVVEV